MIEPIRYEDITIDNNECEFSLVRLFVNGDTSAYDIIYERYVTKVLNYCRPFLYDSHDCEDAVQEIMIKISHKLHTFRFESPLKCWIYKIAVNTCINMSSKIKKKRDKIVNITHKDENGNIIDMDFPDPINSTWKEVIANEKNERLLKAISSLPEKQKNPIILYYFHGLLYKEISVILNLNENTLKSRISRGLVKLKKKLEKYAE